MGVRFRKSFSLGKGMRMNVGKSSLGFSVGTRGARVSINSNGRITQSVGVPGTGLSYVSSKTFSRGDTKKLDPDFFEEQEEYTGPEINKSIPREKIYYNIPKRPRCSKEISNARFICIIYILLGIALLVFFPETQGIPGVILGIAKIGLVSFGFVGFFLRFLENQAIPARTNLISLRAVRSAKRT